MSNVTLLGHAKFQEKLMRQLAEYSDNLREPERSLMSLLARELTEGEEEGAMSDVYFHQLTTAILMLFGRIEALEEENKKLLLLIADQ